VKLVTAFPAQARTQRKILRWLPPVAAPSDIFPAVWFSAAGAGQGDGHARRDGHGAGCGWVRAPVRSLPVSVVVPLAF
jgi:hypothetical protein